MVFTHKARKIVGALVLKDDELKSGTPLAVKLVPIGTITGRLVDDDGVPWAGAKFLVMMLNLDRRNFPDGVETFTADAEGRFRLEGFVPGVETDVFIEASNRPGVALNGGKAFVKPALGPGEIRELGNVKAKPRPR